MLKIAWSPQYVLSLPPNHRFPMSKYELLPQQLLYEGTISEANIFSPTTIDTTWVLLSHENTYLQKLINLSLSDKEIRRTGFPLTRMLVDRELVIMQGTLQCAIYALQYGVAMNIAGGTHHAFSNKGEGFCLLNDIAIAANYLLHEQLVNRILVVDLDVHQGNGTAQIFQHDSRVFTFSMHGANNYPLHKEQSNLDIGLADFTDDNFYLKTLDANLKHLIDSVEPDFIFFQSGVDVLATDKLGKLALSREGCKQRDRLVLETAKSNGIPIVASMGGGYSEDFKDIIEAHANTYRLAQEIFF
ncbi:MAG TPA: histone deacetylase [Cyclobacteriaceae bacterium]|nr:histone deacetylase [Cyclobacteriaceae bacterium]